MTQQIKNIGILCDQSVDVHFPPHFYRVYTDLMQDRGYDTHVIAFYQDASHPNVPAMEDLGLTLLPKSKRFGVLSRLITLPRLYRSLRSEAFANVDTWIVHNDPVYLLLIRLHTRKTDQVLIYRPTHLMPEELMESSNVFRRTLGRIAQRLRNKLLPQCDIILPISGEAERILSAQTDLPRTKLLPLYSTVDPDLHPAPYDGELSNKINKYQMDKWLCYIGTLHSGRQLEIMLDAIDELKKQGVKAGLLIFGVPHQDKDIERLKNHAEMRGIDDRILWHEPVADSQLPAVLKYVDIGLSPFPTRTIMRANAPLKTLDYAVAGLPVIASKIPAHIEMLSQCKLGILADNTGKDFADAARTLFRETPDQITARVESGRDWVKRNRSLESACDTLELAFERCLKQEKAQEEWQKSA